MAAHHSPIDTRLALHQAASDQWQNVLDAIRKTIGPASALDPSVTLPEGSRTAVAQTVLGCLLSAEYVHAAGEKIKVLRDAWAIYAGGRPTPERLTAITTTPIDGLHLHTQPDMLSRRSISSQPTASV